MDSSTYVIGSRLNSLADKLQLVAANLANADTAGFKRTTCAFRQVMPTLLQTAGAMPGSVLPDWPEITGLQVDLAQGAIRRTGRTLDLAIQGEAFFAVETPRGERYTRKGRLHISPEGALTDAYGNPFASDGGSLNVPDGVGRIVVEKDGQVTADGQVLGTLRLVEIPGSRALRGEGQGLYRNDGPPVREALDSQVIQGAVETSNVNAVEEMVAMLDIMRAYEAGSRVLRRMDGLSSALIKTAG